MDNVKVSLSIILPGAVMQSKEEVMFERKDGLKSLDPSKHDCITIKVADNKNRETIKIYTRKSKPAKQVININEENYRYMIQEKPVKFKGNWNGLSNKNKILWHAEQIAASLGGEVDSVEILN